MTPRPPDLASAVATVVPARAMSAIAVLSIAFATAAAVGEKGRGGAQPMIAFCRPTRPLALVIADALAVLIPAARAALLFAATAHKLWGHVASVPATAPASGAHLAWRRAAARRRLRKRERAELK